MNVNDALERIQMESRPVLR